MHRFIRNFLGRFFQPHSHAPAKFGARLAIAMALNGGYGIYQLYMAWREAHSLALLADSFHNLSDVSSIGILWLGMIFAAKASNSKWTGNGGRGELTAAFLNYASLLVLVVIAIVMALYRIISPAEVSGEQMSRVALVGIAINLGTVLMLNVGRGNLNVSAAFWHQVTDLVFSAGVAATGVLIAVTGWNILDPVVTILLSLAILRMIRGELGETWARLRGRIPSGKAGLATCGHHDHAGHAH
jgi:cobalt-zinc-cadmium efflux system protein